MSEQSESKEGQGKEVKRCGKRIVFEGNAICMIRIPDGREDHSPMSCTSARWWCADHELMRVQPNQPCPKCYSESIAKLERSIDILDKQFSLAEHLSSDVEDLQSDFKELRGVVVREVERASEEEILIRSLDPYVTLREIVRIVCCAPVVLAGYRAAIEGGSALDLGLLKVGLWEHVLGDITKALDRLESERIAQIRAEHRKAVEYLKFGPMFLSAVTDLKRAFFGKRTVKSGEGSGHV